MAVQNLPFLLFPKVEPSARDGLPSGRPAVHKPTPERQVERMAPRFQTLQNNFDARRLQLQQALPGSDPEQVVVFETIGEVTNFFKAVRKIPGLEWLLEESEEHIDADDNFYEIEHPDKQLSGRLYLIGSNGQALSQVMSLWDNYKKDPKVAFARGLTPWRSVFAQLRDVRHWSVADRLGQDVRLNWQNKIEKGQDPIRFEIEAWHYSSAVKNNATADEVGALVRNLGGRVIQTTLIDEIAYHGLLVEMPAASVQALLEDTPPELVVSDRIMFFRPQGQASAPRLNDETPGIAHPGEAVEVRDEPIAALLDGLPIQNHPLLAGRLRIDDPDDLGAVYPATDRVHGTSMASLITLGDLDAGEVPLDRILYVRPVLRPDPQCPDIPRTEVTPDDVLLIDLMHRAVRRIFEGEGGEQAAAPTVKIINLSLGDAERPFDRVFSPWARLIDWLSFKYQVLFIVSAGNHISDLTLEIPRESLADMQATDRQLLTLKALFGQSNERPLIAPAETLNGLTIGAFHSDASTYLQVPRRYDLFSGIDVSPYSRTGHGYRRSVKPDLLFPGGRLLHSEQIVGPAETTTVRPIWKSGAAPGLRAAVLPDAGGNTRYSRGTSGATALGTRHAIKAHRVVEELRASHPGRLDPRFDAVLLKALVTHGAEWGDAFERLTNANPAADPRKLKSLASRWMGYGRVDSERVLDCAEERAVVIGVGELSADQAFEFRAPLPPGLAAKVLWRRLTVTLAWISPTNTAHQAYRRARLWISPPAAKFNVTRTETDWQQARKGTLQHEILEGEDALAFVDGDAFSCKVNCAVDAGKFEAPVSFALCVSLEVGEGAGVKVYQEIRDRIAPRIPVGAPGEG